LKRGYGNSEKWLGIDPALVINNGYYKRSIDEYSRHDFNERGLNG